MKTSTIEQLNETFFPVDKRRLFWEDESFFSNKDNRIPCRDWVAIVDMDKKYVFTTAKKSYVIYSNRRTFDFGKTITSELLKTTQDNEVVCVTCNLGKMRATVEYGLSSRLYLNQPQLVDGWVPIITMQNSYNKTKPLTCYVGFRFVEYGFNVLFPYYSVHAKSNHDVPPLKMEKDIMGQLKEKRFVIDGFINYFRKLLGNLKNTKIAPTDFLPLFCKIQKIRVSKNLPDMQKIHLAKSLDFVQDRIKKYTTSYGHNAYALLMVIADYIENLNPVGRLIVAGDQMALGAWAEEFLKESAKTDYSPYDYIGKEAYDAASWFGTLKD